jgi:hypothetical protein
MVSKIEVVYKTSDDEIHDTKELAYKHQSILDEIYNRLVDKPIYCSFNDQDAIVESTSIIKWIKDNKFLVKEYLEGLL